MRRLIGIGAVVVALALAAILVDAQPEEDRHGGSADPIDWTDPTALGMPGGIYESNFTEKSKCPACVAFAAVVRRVSWDNMPKADALAASSSNRKKTLRNDDRVTDIVDEALHTFVNNYVLVPGRQRYAPYVYAKSAGALNPAELELAERQKHHGGDQGLLAYLHNDLRVDFGEKAEGLAGRDMFKGRVVADYVRLPWQGYCDPALTVECADRMASLTLLVDKPRDLAEKESYAAALCKAACGKRHIRTALPLEAEDLGVHTLLHEQEVEQQRLMQAEAEAELEEEAKRFPPDEPTPEM